jgi:hypothetical protein
MVVAQARSGLGQGRLHPSAPLIVFTHRSHREDSGTPRHQTTSCDSMLDGVVTQSQLKELSPSYAVELSAG